MKNVRLIIAYEGTRYFGWQKAAAGPSVEAELEKCLTQILQHPIQLQAASRTDRGVHARHQVVNFFTNNSLEHSGLRLKNSLNRMLPKDISIYEIEEMPETFHPTLDCKGKIYEYSLCLGPVQLPFYRSFSWHFPYPLDIKVMEAGAAIFIGRHDFSALTSEPQEDNTREIYSIILKPLDKRLTIQVSGNSFLYKMVRTIVGTLVYTGCGKLDVHELPSILKQKDRRQAGITAPAHGLCLKRVLYDFTE